MAADDVVARQVADAAVGDAHRFAAPARFQTFGKAVGQADDAHQAALADDGVVGPRPAGELLVTRGARVGRLFAGPGERQEFVRAQPCRVGDLGGERVARGLSGGHEADLLRRVRPPSDAARLQGSDRAQPSALGKLPGDVDEHGLEGLAVHVEGLLPEIAGAGSKVVDGGIGAEVPKLAAVAGDASGYLEQAVAVIGDGAHGGGPPGIAAQRAEIDEASDDGVGLALG